MRALTAAIAAAALLTALAACMSKPSVQADNTAEICAKVSELTQPDPEVGRKALEAFQSSDPALKQAAYEARSEMYRGWAKSVEPLVIQATRPELRTVLQEFVDDLKNGTLTSDGAVKLMNVCGRASTAPSR